MTESQQELLALAAKAAGVEIEQVYDRHACEFVPSWNPYTDKGQLYELAKACKIVINFDEGYAEHWSTLRQHFDGQTDTDAIMLVAAEMGRQMP